MYFCLTPEASTYWTFVQDIFDERRTFFYEESSFPDRSKSEMTSLMLNNFVVVENDEKRNRVLLREKDWLTAVEGNIGVLEAASDSDDTVLVHLGRQRAEAMLRGERCAYLETMNDILEAFGLSITQERDLCLGS